MPLPAALPPFRRPAKTSVKAFALAVVLTSFTSLLVVAGGAWIRFAIAIGFALLLSTLTLIRPGLGVLATFTYLVFMAMLRRMLLPVAPWVSADPMLLVPPLVAVVLIAKAFVLDKRPWAPDAISKLVLVVLALTCAEVVNHQKRSAAGANLLQYIDAQREIVERGRLGDLQVYRAIVKE